MRRLKSRKAHKAAVIKRDFKARVDGGGLHGLSSAGAARIGGGGGGSAEKPCKGQGGAQRSLFIQALCAKQIPLRKRGRGPVAQQDRAAVS